MSIARTGDIFRSRKTRGTYYVSTKGGTSREAASEAVFQQRAEFAFVTHLIKNPCAADVDAATAISRGTMYLPRDMLAKAAYGTLLEVHTDDGRYLGSSREAARDGQLLLATISQARTSIIYRGENDWEACQTTTGSAVLHISASPQMPEWYYRIVGNAELQTTLDKIGADVGDVIVRGQNEWSVVKPGANGTVLVSNGPNEVPYWAEGYVIMSDPQSVLDSVTNVPGSILYRATDKWVGLAAGASGDVLTVDPTTGLPVWHEPGLTVDQLRKALDLLSSAEGSMLVRTADGWGALEPGTSGYALVSQGAGKLPVWAEVSGGGGVSANVPLIDQLDAPAASGFTHIFNCDGATPGPSVTDVEQVGTVIDLGYSASNQVMRGALKPVPTSASWSVRMAWSFTSPGTAYRGPAMAVGNGTKTMALLLQTIPQPHAVVIYYDSETGLLSSLSAIADLVKYPRAMRVDYDGTKYVWLVSDDWVNWSVMRSDARDFSYLGTPAYIGGTAYLFNNSAPPAGVDKNFLTITRWAEITN